MNTNPKAIKILCYGDSNTWGYDPVSEKRYPVGVRWTSILQDKLGQEYWIIEEGLNGRTTNIDDPAKNWRNGFTFLRTCLESHNPIDLVILFLGTNDMKNQFERQPEDLANALGLLIEEIKTSSKDIFEEVSKVIVISPPLIDESIDGVLKAFNGAEKKSKKLGKFVRQVADEHHVGFLDIATIVQPSDKDGIHLDQKGHKVIAETLQIKIAEMCKNSRFD